MAFSEKILREGDRNFVIHVMQEGAASTATEVVDLSAVFSTSTKVAVERIDYSVWGYPEVLLFWDFSTDESIALLNGQSYIDWTSVGGNNPSKTTASGSGDIMLTTATAGAAGLQEAGYDITIWCKRGN